MVYERPGCLTRRIFELWLACWTQQEIAEAVGAEQKDISRTIEGFSQFGESAVLSKSDRAAAEHATDFDRKRSDAAKGNDNAARDREPKTVVVQPVQPPIKEAKLRAAMAAMAKAPYRVASGAAISTRRRGWIVRILTKLFRIPIASGKLPRRRASPMTSHVAS